MILLCCTSTPQSNPNQFWITFIPLISPIVVVTLFLIDRIIGFHLRKREIERNWYLKVLVEPGISKISDFYKRTLEKYSVSAEVLNSKTNTIPHAEYLSLKSQEIGKFQSYKRDLETEFIFPIQMRYPNVGGQLTESLLNLEDCFVSGLDNGSFSEQEIKEFQNTIATNRAVFLTRLYTPLQSKFFSFKKISE